MRRLMTHTRHPVFSRAATFAVVSFCVLLLWFLGAKEVAAQTAFERFGDATTLSQDPIGIIIARVIRVFLGLTGVILTALVVYAGYLYMTAQGVPAQIEKAKNIIKNAVIGLVIIFSSFAITTWILNALLDATYTGSVEAVADSYSEPFSTALGAGVLEDHYPERNASDIPRNTNIFVTFKEAIEVSSIIKDYDTDPTSTDLNLDSVLIYPTEDGVGSALATDAVQVSVTDDHEIFVFDPVDYLGNAETDTNYTVVLTSNIETEDGDPAFTGSSVSGYDWTFEVSTEIDLTPPYVVSVVPAAESEEPRNITIEINFSEAMNPIAVTGTYDGSTELFSNLTAIAETSGQVNGTWEISNGYKTVGFTTTDACGEDPCGDIIYCLPGEEEIDVTVKAATINEDDPPQAAIGSPLYDGAADAASNSLDGDNDEVACGSDSNTITCPDGDDNDNYEWSFETTDEIEDTVPYITAHYPDISEGEIDQTDPVAVSFNGYLKSSTVNTSSVSLWPDPYYGMWFNVRKTDDYDEDGTLDSSDFDGDGIEEFFNTVMIQHPTFVSTDEGGWDYWPVLTNDIKSTYQICMFPAMDELSCGDPDDPPPIRSSSAPWCCEGRPGTSECQTDAQSLLPTPSEGDIVLPNNIETAL